FLDRVNGFGAVTAVGGGGSDTATLNDSRGNHTFTGRQGDSSLSGPSYRFEVKSFKNVTVNASTGSDKGYLYDSAGDDTFSGAGKTGTLSGAGYSIMVTGLHEVWAYGTAGGKNRLHLGTL